MCLPTDDAAIDLVEPLLAGVYFNIHIIHNVHNLVKTFTDYIRSVCIPTDDAVIDSVLAIIYFVFKRLTNRSNNIFSYSSICRSVFKFLLIF